MINLIYVLNKELASKIVLKYDSISIVIASRLYLAYHRLQSCISNFYGNLYCIHVAHSIKIIIVLILARFYLSLPLFAVRTQEYPQGIWFLEVVIQQ